MRKNLFFTMLLAGLTLWLGCEKDNFDLPQDNVQQPALQIPTDMAALLSAEEWNRLQTSYGEALIQRRHEDVILPVSIQMEVYLAYPLECDNGPGDGKVDVAIGGTGSWPEVGQVTYFEVQYAPDPLGFWEGEGSIATADIPFPAYLYFRSEPSIGGPNASNLMGLVMSADLTFTHGKGEFRHAYGEALRKVFVSEDDFGKGTLLICGYVVLPAGVQFAPAEVEMATETP